MSCPVINRVFDAEAPPTTIGSPVVKGRVSMAARPITDSMPPQTESAAISETASPVTPTTLASSPKSPQRGTESVEKEFRNYTTAKVTDLFNVLRKETLDIENNIAAGEKEVLDRDQHAFMMRRHDLAVAYVTPHY